MNKLLLENIPKDLLTAYKNINFSDISSTSAKALIQHTITARPENFPLNSRNIGKRFNYGDASYVKLSPQEAIEYLGIVQRQNSEDYITTLSKQEFAKRLEQLRFICGRYLYQWESRGTLYYVVANEIPSAKLNAAGLEIRDSKHEVTRDSKWIKTISQLTKFILGVADTIYKTDEYDKIPTERKEIEYQAISPTNKENPEYDPHDLLSTIDLSQPTLMPRKGVFDSGAHYLDTPKGNVTGSGRLKVKQLLSEYNEARRTVHTVFQDWVYIKKALKKAQQYPKLTKNAKLMLILEEKEERIREYYIEKKRALDKLKMRLLTQVDTTTLDYKQKITDYITKVSSISQDLYRLTQQLAAIKNTPSYRSYENSASGTYSISDGNKFRIFERKINELKVAFREALLYFGAEQGQKPNAKSSMIDRLKEILVTYGNDIQKLGYSIIQDEALSSLSSDPESADATIQKLGELYLEACDKAGAIVSDKLLSIIDEIRGKIETLGKQLQELQPRAAAKKAERAAKNVIKTDLPDDLKNIISFK